jgi:hypothetical protein
METARIPTRERRQAPPAAGTGYRHKVPLLSARLRYANRHLLYGQARLYGDRIELVGWSLGGRSKESIPLTRIVHVDYHPLREGSNLSVFLDDDRVLHLCVEEAHRWRQTYESWLSYHVLASAKVIGEQEKASAIAG